MKSFEIPAGAVVVCATAAALALAHPLAAQVQFTKSGVPAGIGGDTYTSDTNHALGVIWVDVDNDGWVDLFATNGFDNSPHLYLNNGDGTFSDGDDLLPALPNYEMTGAAFADYENDGDSDIYIFTDNEFLHLTDPINPTDGPPNLLLKNLWAENGGQVIEGQPLFEEVAAAAGVDDLADEPPAKGYPGLRASTGGWLDYNRDGFVDLFVGHWAVANPGHANNADRLYLNNGDGTFTNVSDGCGLHTPAEAPEVMRPALAAIAAHLDGDLWPDIWVGNIMDPVPYQHDFVYTNNGDGTFSDTTASSPGVGDDPPAAKGLTVGGKERDGDWDVYISDIFSLGDPPLGNPLYLGNGDGTFADNSADVAGVQSLSSWGVNFIDVDQDRYLDLFVASQTGGGRDELYINNQDGTFTMLSAASGIDVQAKGRGSAAADYDGDGDLDIVVTYVGQPLTLYRNDTAGAGHWLQVELVGAFSNRDAIGSVVKATVGEEVLMRQVFGGNSAHSQDMLALHFGLDDATTVDQVEILWPSGIVDVLSGVPADRHVTVPECTADVSRDGQVSTADLLAMLSAWGTDPGGPPDVDFNGIVSTSDLLLLLARWGSCL